MVMAPIVSSRTFICASCFRNVMEAERRALQSPFALQMRGKKKMPRDQNILVKLHADIPGYGPKDTIMPIARGRMRNLWYPNGLAEYVTHARRKLVQDQVVERNSNFMKDKTQTAAQVGSAQASKIEPKFDFLQPERSLQIIEQLIPERIDFFRKANAAASAPSTATEQPSSSADGASASEWPVGRRRMASSTEQTPIFGSVSTSDIADNLRAVLASEATKEGGIKDAARVVLTAMDIQIVPSEQQVDSVEGPRIKAIGDFDIDINVRGASVLRRKVRIAAEETEERTEEAKVVAESPN